MLPPWVPICTWICDAPCILHNCALLIMDNKAPKFLLNKIRNMDNAPTALSHEFCLLRLGPFPMREKVIHNKSSLVRTKCFVYIHLHGTSSHLERWAQSFFLQGPSLGLYAQVLTQQVPILSWPARIWPSEAGRHFAGILSHLVSHAHPCTHPFSALYSSNPTSQPIVPPYALTAMRPRPLIWSVVKLQRIVYWFVLVIGAFCLCAISRSDLICSLSSCHPWTLLFCFGSAPPASKKSSIASSSLSESFAGLPPPLSSFARSPVLTAAPS